MIFEEIDRDIRRVERQYCRKWLLSPFMTKSEVVQTSLKPALTAEEHEARERFRYRGHAVFGPHFDIDELIAICDQRLIDRQRMDVAVE